VYLHKRRDLVVPLAKSTKKEREFDPKKFLATIGEGRRAMLFAKKQTIFGQGDG
jgi:hypothetical protein